MQQTRPHRTGRRPTLLDAIVLVAATAIAFVMVRGWARPNWCALPYVADLYRATPGTGRAFHYYVASRVSWTIPFAMTITAALLILRFRSPRPSLRRIARQPGAVACAAALFAIMARMGEHILFYTFTYLTRPSSAVRLPSPPFSRFEIPSWRQTWGAIIHDIMLEYVPIGTTRCVAAAVIVAWVVLLASGRWRPEPSWIDRAGRLLGAYWIALAVAVGILAELWKYLT